MITIEVEPFSQPLIEEILPLAQKCWEESTAQKLQTCAYFGERDFAVKPDVERYRDLAANGILTILTLRDDGRLAGYALAMIYTSWHHQKIKCCAGDNLYIEPAHRSYAVVMVEKLMKEMQRQEVKIVGWPTTQGGPLYELLKAMGFVGDDVVMEKRLCV